MVVKGGACRCGEVGYIATGLKDVKIARVGDTVTEVNSNTEKICSLFTINS